MNLLTQLLRFLRNRDATLFAIGFLIGIVGGQVASVVVPNETAARWREASCGDVIAKTIQYHVAEREQCIEERAGCIGKLEILGGMCER